MSHENFDIAIICALRTPELRSVIKAHGRGKWEKMPATKEDANTYHKTTYVTQRGKNLSVLAGSPTQMGMPASAVLATKMILRFRPKLVAMVGIAAGAKSSKQSFGDILAPNQTLDYGAGKLTKTEDSLRFEPAHRPISINQRLLNRLSDWSAERRALDKIYQDWDAPKPRETLQIHVGPLASGSAVLDDRGPIEETLNHWRKLIGIEMEAYGVHIACRDASEPHPAFLCMKSVCDFATDKDDDWQAYASYTAAQLCYRFILEEWEQLFLDPQ